MARVNVEQKALNDPRFYRLGLDLGAEEQFAQAVGLYAMIRVWNECIENGKYILDGWVLQAIVSKTNGAAIMVSAGLAVPVKGNKFRIKGTKGRVEYLEKVRLAGEKGAKYGKLGAEFGVRGGRPKKTPHETPGEGVLKPPVGGDTKTPLITPAPNIEEESKSPAFDFDMAWDQYPRKLGRHEAELHFRAQVKTQADYEALLSAIRNYAIECGLLDREEKYVQHGSTFFNARWKDYIDGVWKAPAATKEIRPAPFDRSRPVV